MGAKTDKGKIKLAGLRPALMPLALFSLAANLLVLGIPLYTLQVFDRVLSSQSIDTLLLLTLAVSVVILVQVLIDGVRSMILRRVSARFEIDTAAPAMETMLLASSRGAAPSAQVLRDVSEVRQVLGSPQLLMLFDLPWAPVFLFACFLLHHLIGLIAVAGFIALFCIAAANSVLVDHVNGKLNSTSIKAFQQLEDYSDHAGAILSMGMTDRLILRWLERSYDLTEQQLAVQRVSSIMQTASKWLRMTLQISVMGMGCYLVILSEMTAGAMIAGSILMARAVAPAEQALGAWRVFANAREAWRRIKEAVSESAMTRPTVPVGELHGRLSVERLSLGFPGSNAPVLRNINLDVAPGTIVGLIGPSGSGKSSLARILVGIHEPTTGDARLDGIDLASRAMFDLGDHIGYLPQDVQLFHGTARENIARLAVEDPAFAREAAEVAGVNELILSLPEGYDTVIGRGGYALSGGQQQRIALARAIYKNPKLVVLDEPDSNLDPDGVRALISVIQRLKEQDAVVFLITHRAQLLAFTDRLVMLESGEMKMDGERDSILEALGYSGLRALPTSEARAEVPKLQGPEEEALPPLPSIRPLVVNNWPQAAKELWVKNVDGGRLHAEDSERRKQAICFGYWLAWLKAAGFAVQQRVAKERLPEFISLLEEASAARDDIDFFPVAQTTFEALGLEGPAAALAEYMASDKKAKKT